MSGHGLLGPRLGFHENRHATRGDVLAIREALARLQARCSHRCTAVRDDYGRLKLCGECGALLTLGGAR